MLHRVAATSSLIRRYTGLEKLGTSGWPMKAKPRFAWQQSRHEDSVMPNARSSCFLLGRFHCKMSTLSDNCLSLLYLEIQNRCLDMTIGIDRMEICIIAFPLAESFQSHFTWVFSLYRRRSKHWARRSSCGCS